MQLNLRTILHTISALAIVTLTSCGGNGNSSSDTGAGAPDNITEPTVALTDSPAENVSVLATLAVDIGPNIDPQTITTLNVRLSHPITNLALEVVPILVET